MRCLSLTLALGSGFSETQSITSTKKMHYCYPLIQIFDLVGDHAIRPSSGIYEVFIHFRYHFHYGKFAAQVKVR